MAGDGQLSGGPRPRTGAGDERESRTRFRRFRSGARPLRPRDTPGCRPPGVRVTVSGEGAGELPGRRDASGGVERAGRVRADRRRARRAWRSTASTGSRRHGGWDRRRPRLWPESLLARAFAWTAADVLDDDRRAAARRARSRAIPDNVAPCLLGGFTIAWMEPAGARAVRLEPSAPYTRWSSCRRSVG